MSVGTPHMVTNVGFSESNAAFGTRPSGERRPSDVEGLFSSGRSSTTEATIPFLQDSLTEPNFHWKTAVAMALASRLAYENASIVRITARAAEWGFEFCDFVEAEDTQGFDA